MASTATLFTPIGKQFPFIGVGPAAQVITFLPSAELIFTIVNGAVTVAAAGEDQSLLINCDLPRSFCYVLVECSMLLDNPDADEWDRGTNSVLQDSVTSPDVIIPCEVSNEFLAFESSSVGANQARVYTLKNGPSKVIVPTSSQGAGPTANGRFRVFLGNTTIDGLAGFIHFHARFLVYDRNQAQYWQVNTPVLTR